MHARQLWLAVLIGAVLLLILIGAIECAVRSLRARNARDWQHLASGAAQPYWLQPRNWREPQIVKAVTVSLRSELLSTDPFGFAQVAKLHAECTCHKETQITIDLSGVEWMAGHLAVPLRVIIRHAQARGNVLRLINATELVRMILGRNRFFATKVPDIHNTTLPTREFAETGSVEFSMYAKQHLNRPQMPKMTHSLREKFFEGIDEIFANSTLHSKTPVPIVVGGQFFPRSRRLTFAIADGGRGIKGSLRDELHRQLPAHEAIDWAMEPFNTTRQGDIPGGLGSKVVREFIQLNGGKLVVVSNNGYWCQTGQQVVKHRLAYEYPGTVVILEIDTSDRRSYGLEAPDPREIW